MYDIVWSETDKSIKKPADSAGFMYYGGGHEIRWKPFLGLQKPIIQAHFSSTVPIVAWLIHFVWSNVWSEILKSTA